MNKEEQESKKDIAKKLKLSNKKLWDSLSVENQNIIVSEYYDSLDVSHIGISGVLSNIRDTGKDLALVIIGLLLGFLGSMANSIFAKYLPEGHLADIFFVFFFILVIILFFRGIKKLNIEQLRDYKVLEYFAKSIKKEK